MEDRSYLQKGFNPKSLTVPRLRGILNEHDVSVPSNAKKADLVDAFETHISPQAEALLAKHEAKSANANGASIVNGDVSVGSVDGVASASEAEVEAPPKPKSKKSKTQAATATAASEEEQPKSKKATPKKAAAAAAKSPQQDVKESEEAKEEVEEKKPKKSTKTAKASKSSDPAKSETKKAATKSSKSKSKSKKEKENEAETSNVSSPSSSVASPFSSDNIFQSPPQSTIPKKRSKSPEPSSPSRLKLTKLSPKPHTPRGKLFDVDDESDKDDLFKNSLLSKSPAKTPAKTPLKEAKEAKESKKATKSKIAKPADKEKTKKKESLKKAIKREVKDESKDEASEIKEEVGDSTPLKEEVSLEAPKFESFLKSIEEPVEQQELPPSGVPLVDLAQQLGITIQGLPSQAPEEKPAKSRKSTPRKAVALTADSPKTASPRLRKTQLLQGQAQNQSSPLSQGGPVEKTPSKTSRKSTPKKVSGSTSTSKKATPKKIAEDKNTLDLLEENLKEDVPAVESTKKKTARSTSATSPATIITFIVLWLSLFSVGLFGWWYREQTFLIGYCGQEIFQDTIPDDGKTPKWLSSVGQYLDTYKPQCAPCPPHGRCFPLLELSCYNDFIEHQPWYYNLVPFPVDSKKCIPDTKKAEKLEIMIDVALDLLRSRNAAKNCGRNSEDDLSSGLSIVELHDMLLQMKAPYITKEEFEELWSRSLIELEKEPEIITGYGANNISTSVDSNHTREEKEKDKIFRSTSLSHNSLKCQVSNTIIGSLTSHKLELLVLIATFFLFQYAKFKLNQYRLYQRKVGTLYTEVLNKLRKQRKLASASSSNSVPTFIGSTQLRDLILTHEVNLTAKMKLWESVAKKVENNSNIRYSLQESHGEIMRVWEWITDVE